MKLKRNVFRKRRLSETTVWEWGYVNFFITTEREGKQKREVLGNDVFNNCFGGAVCLAAYIVSGLGLGRVLMPVFALFFPVELAIVKTGVVYLANNLFNLELVHIRIDWRLALYFGLSAMAAAFFGAWVLLRLEQLTLWHCGQ